MTRPPTTSASSAPASPIQMTNIQGDGMSWGDWSEAQHCYVGQGICAIQTQVEPYMADNGDDTMLNNVRFECCDMNMSPAAEAAEAAATQLQDKIVTVADLSIEPEQIIIINPSHQLSLSRANVKSQAGRESQE